MNAGSSLVRLLASPYLWLVIIFIGTAIYIFTHKDRFQKKDESGSWKFCSHCGTRNLAENRFCEKCGMKFTD
jgi:hypothetical protein